MSHGIELPIDKVISTEGSEWHGLAEVAEKIDTETVKPLCFEIISGEIIVKIDDKEVKMTNHKALVADFRECRPELIEDCNTSSGLVPLHIPKTSYKTISNKEVWDSMCEALEKIDAKVTSAGTLEGGKKFFLSAKLGDECQFKINNDDYFDNLNFITSHDGSLGVEAYNSCVRIICLNTLRWSREAAGDIGFKVYHTSNSELAMKNLGSLVQAILLGRADFKNQMEYLAKEKISQTEATQFIAGYFVNQPGFDEVAGLSTRARNQISAIGQLFSLGKGNHGKNLYDLLNGATEYWTSGDGTGKKSSPMEKMYKANFGSSADHKNAICNALMDSNKVKEFIKLGEKVL